ncbi:MAG: DUF4147 domain-containing protein [Cohaesibacter sp.]|nr:DUF4147 domain-containing protein [Cohaesibacter sp.]
MTHGQMEQLHSDILDIFQNAVAAADPAHALQKTLLASPFPTPEKGGLTCLIAIGKAAPAMLTEAMGHVTGPCKALAITHPENQMSVEGVTVLHGAHPVPDETSLIASQAVIEHLSDAGENDQVIALISGGGSALVAAPVGGISLADKAKTNQLLLGSGLDITQINLVRQNLSQLKGGGFLRHAAPAQVSAYILSDVIGDDLRAIASGPTVAPIGNRQEAREICKQAAIWNNLPKSVQDHLKTEPEQNQSIETIPFAHNQLIGSNRHSLQAALKAASQHYEARIVSDQLIGDVEIAAKDIAAACQAHISDKPIALLFGGETTVKLKGNGQGGRNQELALHVAKLLTPNLKGQWIFLSAGTDGRDGPTDAAGGIIDGQTLTRIEKAGLDLEQLLNNNDSYKALKAADDLLIMKATGTNVADIQCFLHHPGT